MNDRAERESLAFTAKPRDPAEIGHEWTAWWALQGDEPLERVRECAVELQRQLGELGQSLHQRDDLASESVVSATRFFLITLAELLDENGTSEFKATISRRKRGKPINKSARARKGNRAAGIVERLVKSGWKQEAALQQAVTDTELSRAEIMTWLRSRRARRKGNVTQTVSPEVKTAMDMLLAPYRLSLPNSGNNQD